MPDFEGLRALVTGGASGIGLTTARLLAAEGATVAVLDREPFADAEHDHLHFIQADVTDDAAVRRAVEAAIAQLGGFDVLVNNAGIGAQGGVEDNLQRTMFGSDWPVSTLRADYVDVVTVTSDLLAGCSEAETAAVFGSSAASWYRLDGRR